MGGITRREALRFAGAGALALTLPGCGGSDELKAASSSPEEWRQFGGTTLNFISENTAPTSAIAANLKPFTDLTGIEIKIVQLELAALVQKVALDFASGVGSYQIVYADPYQILAPYHEALVDLNTMMKDPNLPKLDDVGDFIPTQLDAAGKFVDKDKLYALPYDAPTMIWQYRKDLFEKYGDRMKQDLGFDPTPSDDSTWEQFYKTSKWFKENAQDDVPYGHGHQAKQHDSLMNDFSNVLWAYGGDYFKDGNNVGRMGSSDPGDPVLDSPEAVEAADFYRKLVSIAHPGSLGWDWDGLGAAFGAGQMAMAVNWHEFASGNETGKLKGKVGYARLPQGPQALRVHVRRHRRRASTPRPPSAIRRPPGCSSTGRPRRRPSSPTSRARSAAARRRATPSTSCRRSRRRRSRRRRCPTSSPPTRSSRPGSPRTSACGPRSPAWNECDTAIFTQLSKMLAGQQGPEKCMSNSKDGFMQAIDNADALRNA